MTPPAVNPRTIHRCAARKAITTGALTTIAALRNFDLVYLTTSGGPGDATTVPAFEVYQRAFRGGEVGGAAAVGVCLAAVIFALSFGINRVAERAART